MTTFPNVPESAARRTPDLRDWSVRLRVWAASLPQDIQSVVSEQVAALEKAVLAKTSTGVTKAYVDAKVLSETHSRMTADSTLQSSIDTLETDLDDAEADITQLQYDVAHWAPDGAVNGPPTSGTYTLYELWIDQNLSVWLCTTAGTPGSWRQVVPAVLTAFPGGSVPTGYEVVRSDLDRLRFRYDGSGWVKCARFHHVQAAASATWTVTHNFGYYPAAIAVIIGGKPVGCAPEHTSINAFTLDFTAQQAGDVYCE